MQKSHLFPVEAVEVYTRTEEALEWLAGALSNSTALLNDPAAISIIESWLSGHTGKFLTGKGLTVADLAVAGHIAAHQQMGSLGPRGKVGANDHFFKDNERHYVRDNSLPLLNRGSSIALHSSCLINNPTDSGLGRSGSRKLANERRFKLRSQRRSLKPY